MKTEFS